MLTKYLKENGISKKDFSKMIGITRQHLENILKKKEPNLSVKTAMKIRQLAGLEPEQYLNGLKSYIKYKNK